jgi:hypothetical protein
MYAEGDASANGLFGTEDLVLMFVDGGYDPLGGAHAVSTVPEPSGVVLVLGGSLMFVRGRRRPT